MSFDVLPAVHGCWHTGSAKLVSLLAGVLSSFPPLVRSGSPPSYPHSHLGSVPWPGVVLSGLTASPRGQAKPAALALQPAQPALSLPSDASKTSLPLPLNLADPSS